LLLAIIKQRKYPINIYLRPPIKYGSVNNLSLFYFAL